MIRKLIAWILSWFAKAAPPAVEVAEKKVAPISEHELRARWRPVRIWCADHEGRGFKRPARAPAPEWLWKRDLEGRAWRLYRAPIA